MLSHDSPPTAGEAIERGEEKKKGRKGWRKYPPGGMQRRRLGSLEEGGGKGVTGKNPTLICPFKRSS